MRFSEGLGDQSQLVSLVGIRLPPIFIIYYYAALPRLGCQQTGIPFLFLADEVRHLLSCRKTRVHSMDHQI